jgi:hypothetical protein
MREIVIHHIYVIEKQVKECVINCTLEKYIACKSIESISIFHPINLRYANIYTLESYVMTRSKKNSLLH